MCKQINNVKRVHNKTYKVIHLTGFPFFPYQKGNKLQLFRADYLWNSLRKRASVCKPIFSDLKGQTSQSPHPVLGFVILAKELSAWGHTNKVFSIPTMDKSRLVHRLCFRKVSSIRILFSSNTFSDRLQPSDGSWQSWDPRLLQILTAIVFVILIIVNAYLSGKRDTQCLHLLRRWNRSWKLEITTLRHCWGEWEILSGDQVLGREAKEGDLGWSVCSGRIKNGGDKYD